MIVVSDVADHVLDSLIESDHRWIRCLEPNEVVACEVEHRSGAFKSLHDLFQVVRQKHRRRVGGEDGHKVSIAQALLHLREVVERNGLSEKNGLATFLLYYIVQHEQRELMNLEVGKKHYQRASGGSYCLTELFREGEYFLTDQY